jgi:putative ABC transport system permease protein
MRAQAFTITLVVACAVASYVSISGTWDSLYGSRDSYYATSRFGDVFARLRRAPRSVAQGLASVPGVGAVYAYLEEPIRVPMPALREPAVGRLVSIPSHGRPGLNDVHLLSGRMPVAGAAREAVLLSTFANAHKVRPGDELTFVANSREVRVRVVGTALSPEYILPGMPGGMTDDSSFAVVWIPEPAAEALLDMGGSFNALALTVLHGASTEGAIAAVDAALTPYGGFGAHDRDGQLSHAVVEGELRQLEGMATVVPVIFLCVAAFLLNVVISRVVRLEREQIAVLKAVGYSNTQLAVHYLAFVIAIAGVGALGGLAVGQWLGDGLVALYGKTFRFPVLAYSMSARHVVIAFGTSALSAITGALFTLRSVVSLPPAEAMRPPSPPTYRRSVLERLRLHRILGQSWRMILRDLERHPWRMVFSALGIAFSIGILITGRFSYDSIDEILAIHYGMAQRGDVQVSFAAARPISALRELEHIPGVIAVEGTRSVPVRIRAGSRHRNVVLMGRPDGASLRQLVEWPRRVVPMPLDGVVLTEKLAEILAVKPGDKVTVEFLEGTRTTHAFTVAGTAREVFGLFAHTRLSVLDGALSEETLVTQAEIAVAGGYLDAVSSRIGAMPGVATVSTRRSALERFEKQTGENMRTMTLVVVIFAAVIAFGVVYNNARVSLSTKSRDLASLRVLGFTRGEISGILLGELFVQSAVGVLPGLWIGNRLAHAIASMTNPEAFRFPVVIYPRTYAFAVVVAAVAATLSALLVRRRIDHLDLIGVLKTRGG